MHHSTDERSWFNIQQLERCGDIHLNPGPIKFPCKECEKSVRNNQNAMLCSECGLRVHAKYLNMSTSTFKDIVERPAIDWTCLLCSLPRFFLEDEEIMITTEGDFANELLTVAHKCHGTTAPTRRKSRQLMAQPRQFTAQPREL